MFCLQETHFRSKDTNKLKLKGWENKFHESSNQKWCEVAIQISDKIDFSQNLSQKTKKGHYISIKDLYWRKCRVMGVSELRSPEEGRGRRERLHKRDKCWAVPWTSRCVWKCMFLNFTKAHYSAFPWSGRKGVCGPLLGCAAASAWLSCLLLGAPSPPSLVAGVSWASACGNLPLFSVRSLCSADLCFELPGLLSRLRALVQPCHLPVPRRLPYSAAVFIATFLLTSHRPHLPFWPQLMTLLWDSTIIEG